MAELSGELFGLTACEVPGVGAGVRVNLHSGNRFVPTQILMSETFATMASGLSGVAGVLLEGRSACWMYAAATLAAIHAGAGMVAIHYPQEEVWVVAYGRQPDAGTTLEIGTMKACEPEKATLPKLVACLERERLKLSFAEPPGNDLRPGMLAGLDEVLPGLVPVDFDGRVIWDDRTTIWLFSALSAWLWVHRPKATIGIFSPHDGGDVIVASAGPSWQPGMVVPTNASGRGRTLRVGVIGDPNSGKSVLSWKVYYALGRLGVSSYRLDADIRAPTARWRESEHGDALRVRQKVEWDDERDVPMLLERLAGLQRSGLDLALIDLPGGNHASDPPERIPPARRELFRAIDAFVLVQKSDEVASAWRAALEEAGVTSPVVAEVLSRMVPELPDAGGRVRDEDDRWRTAALDRETIGQPDEAVTLLAGWLSGFAASWQESSTGG